MIIALEIGAALSLVVMIAGYAANLPKPKRAPIRVKNERARRHGPHRG